MPPCFFRWSMWAMPFVIKPEEVRMRSVVITGTSTGIGWGAAKVLINNGFRVFGSVQGGS